MTCQKCKGRGIIVQAREKLPPLTMACRHCGGRGEIAQSRDEDPYPVLDQRDDAF